MGLIFSFSSNNGNESSNKSDRLLIKTVEVLKKDKLTKKQKENIVDKYSFIIRKCAHMFLYFVLSVITFLLLKEFYDLKPITIIYTLIFCIIYAITDEIHQAFIPGRSARAYDVAIDTLGSFIALIIPIIKTKKCYNQSRS